MMNPDRLSCCGGKILAAHSLANLAEGCLPRTAAPFVIGHDTGMCPHWCNSTMLHSDDMAECEVKIAYLTMEGYHTVSRAICITEIHLKVHCRQTLQVNSVKPSR